MALTYLRSRGLAAGVGGKVLQVVSTTKTDSFNSSSTSLVDITDLSASITPSSTSNKILVFGNIQSNSINGSIITFQLVRNSTEIAKGTNAYTFIGTVSNYCEANSTNYNLTNNSFSFYDSPSSTSSTTYKVQVKTNGGTIYINNRGTNDSSYIATITAMEISA